MLLIFFFFLCQSSTGRWISFFSQTDVFQVLIGENLNRICRKWCLLALLFVVRRWSRSNSVSVTGSGVSYVCIWALLQCTQYYQFFFWLFHVPIRTCYFDIFKNTFFLPDFNLFLGAKMVFCSLFWFGSSLSKSDHIFLVNIVSAGEAASAVLGLGVILYTGRNYCSALSVGVPDPFLSARFNVSTKHSAWPFDLGWYCCVVTWKISQNSLNLTDVNWLPLSLTTQSTTPNHANSSCRNPIIVPVVGQLHLRTSDHLEWQSTTIR